MKSKLRITNILACILVIVIAFATINMINIDQEKNNSATASNASSGQENIPITDIDDGNENDPENPSDGTKAKLKFGANDYQKAFDSAKDCLENGLGWKSSLNAKLKITAGINVNQNIQSEKQKFSDGSYYFLAKTTGTFANNFQEGYSCLSKGSTVSYCRDSENFPITSTRKVYSEEELIALEGTTYGTFPLVVNKDTILMYDSQTQTNGYNPASSSSYKAYYNTNTKMENYEYTLPLDCNLSTVTYKYCVRSNSVDVADGNFPIFTKVVLNFVINEKGEFVSYSLDMVYKMYTKGVRIEGICYFTSTDIFSQMNEYQTMQRPTWAR